MSGEMIAIVAVGVALAGVILTSLRGTEARKREVEGYIGDLERSHGAHGAHVCSSVCIPSHTFLYSLDRQRSQQNSSRGI